MSLIISCSFDMATDFAKIDVREDVDPRKASSVVEMMTIDAEFALWEHL